MNCHKDTIHHQSLSVRSRFLDDFTAVLQFWNGPRGQLRGKDSPSFAEQLQWLGKLMGGLLMACTDSSLTQVVGGRKEDRLNQKANNKANNSTNKHLPGQVTCVIQILLFLVQFQNICKCRHSTRLCSWNTIGPQCDGYSMPQYNYIFRVNEGSKVESTYAMPYDQHCRSYGTMAV